IEEDLDGPRLNDREDVRRLVGHGLSQREAEHIAVERDAARDIRDDEIGRELGELMRHRTPSVCSLMPTSADPARTSRQVGPPSGDRRSGDRRSFGDPLGTRKDTISRGRMSMIKTAVLLFLLSSAALASAQTTLKAIPAPADVAAPPGDASKT